MQKKLLALILSLCLLTSLTACGGKTAKDDTIVYVPELISIEPPMDEIQCSCMIGDSVYIWGARGSGSVLVRVSEGSNIAEPLPDYQQIAPPDIPNISSTFLESYSGSLQVTADGTLWESVPMRVTTYAMETNSYSTETFYILRHLQKDGKELSRLDIAAAAVSSSLPDSVSGMGYFIGLSVDEDETIYAIFDSGIVVLDKEGNPLFTIDAPEGAEMNSAIVLSDGRIGVKCQRGHTIDDMETCLRVLNKEIRDWDDAILLVPGINVSVYGGDDNALFYFRLANMLYAWREGAVEGEQLLSLIDANISANALSNVFAQPDGCLVLAVKDFYSDDFQLAYLTPTPAYQLGQTVLTLATFWMSPALQQAVQEFNQTNGKYHISVTDYSQYGDGSAAMTRMAVEIGAGKMPDILDMSLNPDFLDIFQEYLEDLWGYIDSDPELDRDKLMVRALEAETVDGNLYTVGSAFGMYSYTGLASVVGQGMTWTMEDMQAALAAMPEGSVLFLGNRERMLEALISLGWSRFVDKEKGTCRFDSSEFRDVLVFCAGMPERSIANRKEWIDAYRDGEVILLPMGISDFYFPQYGRYLFGGEVSFAGIPNDWGLAGSSMGLTEMLAMSNTCEHKEGAWAFLRTRLLPQISADKQTAGYYNGFPINKDDFDFIARQAMTPEYEMEYDGTYALDSKGRKIEKEATGGYREDGMGDLRYYAVTQADYDQIMALYNAIEGQQTIAPEVLSVITEVAGAYFAGDKTLDEAVELIQNRVELYVKEQF